jgi:hypothetical protein
MSPTPEEIAAAAAQKAKDDAAKAEADKAKAEAEKKADPVAAFEEYLDTLPEEERTKIEEYTAGLKTALIKERKLNPEGKKAVEELQKLKADEEKRKQAEMTDLQKAEAAKKAADEKNLKLEEDLKTERIKNAVLAEASKQGFEDPQDAYAMIDRAELEISADGKVDGVEEAIKALVKAKPYLLGTGEETARRVDINSGNKGRQLKNANLEEIKKQKLKSNRYRPI